MKVNKLIIIVLLIFLGGAVLIIRSRAGNAIFVSSVVAPFLAQNQVPAPTPLPFVEMTIPYLRSRTYTSTLGPRTLSADNGSYTSYTTSYDSDGLKINELLTIPKGNPPVGGGPASTRLDPAERARGGWPAIVFVHGYIPPTQYRTTDNYVSYVDYLASRGFVVFKIDLRGHGQSEGEPGGAYYSSDYVIDTLNARAALAASDFVAKDTIGLWGHSMAGNVVMRAFVTQPNIPAVVIWAGAGYTYQDLLTYRISDASYRPPQLTTPRAAKRQLMRNLYGDFAINSHFWKQVAVTDYLSDIRGALQIHHAVDDNVVSVEYSRNLTKLLDGTTVDHTLYEYPAGGHNIEGSSFTKAMQRTADFFRYHL